MAYTVVQSCPPTYLEWSSRASSTCSRDTYHCVEDEYSRIVKVCITQIWIEQDSGCQQFSLGTTTSTGPLANTPMSDTSDNSIIAGSVISVFAVILLGILGFILWRKKRPSAFQACLLGREQTHLTNETCKRSTGDETEPLVQSEIDAAAIEGITPKELDVDKVFISRCQNYLETRGNTLALVGTLGSGKRTIASQIAIRLAKKDPELKIKIIRDRDVISKDLESRQISKPTIIIIHNPVKTWFISKHTDEIINCLLEMCTNAKTNNSYIIAIFHYNNWDSFKLQIGNKSTTMEHIFPKRESICNDMRTLSAMAKSNYIGKPSVRIHTDERSIGDRLIMTLFLKNREFQNPKYLSNPAMFIFEKLKTLNTSPEIIDQLAFKTMFFFVLHNGELHKSEIDDISHHSLFSDLNEKINIRGYIDECIKKLLALFIEETLDGQNYRIMHDVITRCTFLAAMENYWTLLFTECDPVLIFECIRLKSGLRERAIHSGEIVFDERNLKIALPTAIFPMVARLLYQRSEMRSLIWNSRLYDNQIFQEEWNKAELHLTNTDNRHEKSVEVN